MKLSLIAFVGHSIGAEKSWFTKEWQVIQAHDAGDEIVLQNPMVRSNVQWHDCGEKPATPLNARDVRCRGTWCTTVCKKGYRSSGAWRSRCQPNGSWTRDTLTDCISCSDPPAIEDSVEVQKIHVKNLAVRQFFCGKQSNQFTFANQTMTNYGGAKKNVKCLCKRASPWKWDKTCNWYHRNTVFTDADFQAISCSAQ